YQRPLLFLVPPKAENAAVAVAKHNRTAGSLFPGVMHNFSLPLLQLPVEEERTNLRNIPRSQLVRASTPWIQYWRVPSLGFGEHALMLSRFKMHYWARTDLYTRTLAQRMKQRAGVNLPILRGLDVDRIEKGREEWTRAEGSRTADQLFCLIG